ncbi:trypsin-like serine protease [Ramicandelaber brevisporus]|nr:trypsin-like serine protease [Ramicandelaber brevisporus]
MRGGNLLAWLGATVFAALSITTSTLLAASTTHSGGSNVTPRIIGGTEAQPSEFPFAIYITVTQNIDSSKTSITRCTGVLVTHDAVLTAAHCVYVGDERQRLVSPNNITIAYGNVAVSKAKTAKAAAVYVPDDYDSATLKHDLAVIRLSQPLQFTDSVQRIPFSDVILPPKTNVTAMGWGFTKQNTQDSAPDTLMQTYLQIAPDSECKIAQIYQTQAGPVLCTGNTPSHDTCEGDSGGPLVYKDPKDGQLKLLGTTSFGQSKGSAPMGLCGLVDMYAFFTRVSYYANFVAVYSGIDEKSLYLNGEVVAKPPGASNSSAPTAGRDNHAGNGGYKSGYQVAIGGIAVSLASSVFNFL